MRKRRKEKKKTKKGEKVAPAKARFRLPYTKNFFFWFTSIWAWKRPILVEVSAPMRLSLQGSNVRRKFRKWTTYAVEQYLKRTTLRTYRITHGIRTSRHKGIARKPDHRYSVFPISLIIPTHVCHLTGIFVSSRKRAFQRYVILPGLR